jgi:hypothetical protein
VTIKRPNPWKKLLKRIEEKGVNKYEYKSPVDGCCCVIGHMAEISGFDLLAIQADRWINKTPVGNGPCGDEEFAELDKMIRSIRKEFKGCNIQELQHLNDKGTLSELVAEIKNQGGIS